MEIQVKDIAKSYGGLKAVDRITFDINRGEVYGIIGPNGAGKTTLMEIMLGLRRQDGGTVTIQGLDSAPAKDTIVELIFDAGAEMDNRLVPAAGRTLFIPNTYRFYWNTSAEEFFERMCREYDRFWNASRREKAEAIGMSPLEVTTLASIVQAETAKVDERPVVAGLYMNRLDKGIRLQSDPTVIFAMRLAGRQDTIRRVYLSDLKIDSPYNTYKHKGLPPSPINIPDISSIDAVLDYTRHNYIYMCASVERFGYHEFAAGSAQHNRNRRAYIRWLNEKNIK